MKIFTKLRNFFVYKPPVIEEIKMIDSYSQENEKKLEERISFLGYTIGLTLKRLNNPQYGLLREYGMTQMGAAVEKLKTERLALILEVEAIREFNRG